MLKFKLEIELPMTVSVIDYSEQYWNLSRAGGFEVSLTFGGLKFSITSTNF